MQISSPLQGLVKGAKFIITSKITNHLRQIKKCTITFFSIDVVSSASFTRMQFGKF